MHPADSFDTMARARVGVISDTHGQLHPSVGTLFRGVDLIIHAGDVCGHGVLEGLREIAPLRAVAGNCDDPCDVPGLPGFDQFIVAGAQVALIHNINKLSINPSASNLRVVVYGHTHVATVERVDGVLYVNPGSAGPPRFGRPRSVAILQISASEITAEVVEFAG